MRLGAWDGESWRSLDAGPGGGISDGYVLALGTYHGDLVAAGYFWTAGGAPAQGIARYKEATGWRSLGGGIGPGERNTGVYALAELNGDLIIGGEFLTAGGVAVSNIARWTDDPNASGQGHWGTTALGGVDSGQVSTGGWGVFGVHALAAYNGNLFVGGGFTHAGGIETPGIARWDGVPGSSWLPMNPGTTAAATISSLAVWHGELYAAGQFSGLDGVVAWNIARWNGAAWSPVGSGIQAGDTRFAFVQGLATFNDELIAVGNFWYAGGTGVSGVARWNGQRWAALGDGSGIMSYSATRRSATALWARPFRGQLVAGGYYFDDNLPPIAATFGIPLFALWGCACPADADGSGALDAQDIFAFISNWFAHDPRADFNGIDGVTIQDIFDFLNAWFAGC
ncbi:MAG TPA: GC-type dockerin domain-anchored protein [Phycisphaerales bacterium]|nr:GC-type dockerin domain-anchored protein [Phycisphaerales bacterium]